MPAQNRSVFLLLLIIFCSIFVSAQGYEKDKIEAKEIARNFYNRFEKTKNISPLLPEFFTDNFLEKDVKNAGEGEWLFLFLTKNTASQITADELQNDYITFHNFYYLYFLYCYSKYSSTSDIPSVEKTFPPDVWQIIKTNSDLKELTNETKNSDDSPIKNVRQLRSFVYTLEKATARLRIHVRNLNLKKTKSYQETLADFQARFHLFEPWVKNCEERCYGLEPESKIITVNIPFFQLAMARINGKMKILMMDVYID